MYIPDFDNNLLKESKKMVEAHKQQLQKQSLWEWIKDKGIDLLALIVFIVALVRTF